MTPPNIQKSFLPTQEQERERERLFKLIEAMVLWENSHNEAVLAQVQAEIRKATGGNPPPVLDPFAGGGSIPLEAQRLGLEAHASDLNPVAVLINKALIEIPPKFANRPPVNPEARKTLLGRDWQGAHGLADDIRYYGKWMRDEAEKRIGHLYPKVTLPKEYGGGEATVIAWLWTRTVTCPNPACGTQMPLVRSFCLSKKKGQRRHGLIHRLIIAVAPPTIHFCCEGRQRHTRKIVRSMAGSYNVSACGTTVPFRLYTQRRQSWTNGCTTHGNSCRRENMDVFIFANAPIKRTCCYSAKLTQWKPEAVLPHNPRRFLRTKFMVCYFWRSLLPHANLWHLQLSVTLCKKQGTRCCMMQRLQVCQ